MGLDRLLIAHVPALPLALRGLALLGGGFAFPLGLVRGGVRLRVGGSSSGRSRASSATAAATSAGRCGPAGILARELAALDAVRQLAYEASPRFSLPAPVRAAVAKARQQARGRGRCLRSGPSSSFTSTSSDELTSEPFILTVLTEGDDARKSCPVRFL